MVLQEKKCIPLFYLRGFEKVRQTKKSVAPPSRNDGDVGFLSPSFMLCYTAKSDLSFS